jgi:hypothetical protein
MADILSEINQNRQILSYECLKLIADILRFILTLFVHEQLYDYRLFYMILECSQYIYYTQKKRKVYLSALLYDHGIWSDMTNWKECIDFIIKLKIDDAVKRKKRKELYDKQNGIVSNDKADVKKNPKEFFKKGGRFLKGVFQTKEDKNKQLLSNHQNMIFNELSHFVQHFINLNLPF